MPVLSTLSSIDGYRIERFLGLAIGVGSQSARSSHNKTLDALNLALDSIMKFGKGKGANAILGLTQQVNGASAGAVGLGGDAVTVVLIGTAVQLVKDEAK